MTDEYDPKTCVTAGEVRAMGGNVPAAVPDCAWIRRVALRFIDSTVSGDRTARELTVSMSFVIDDPWRWTWTEWTVVEGYE